MISTDTAYQEGISFTIFEAEVSASHYRPREWGCSIQWALPLLHDLLPDAKFDLIQTASLDPHHTPPDPDILPIYNGATGEHLKNVPLTKYHRISRRRFRQFLAEEIDVQYNKQLTSIIYASTSDRPTVTAHFADDTTATGALLIGTDGAQSKVRSCIFGVTDAATKRVPYTAINLHVCYNDAGKALFVRQNPIISMGIHPGGHWQWISVQDVPDANDPATWVFQLQSTWESVDGEEGVGTLENLKKHAEGYGEPFRSANLWIPECTKVFENKLSYWEPKAWDSRGGRVLLAGDAAHPMTFHRGQGLNHGIADARRVVLGLKEAVLGKVGLGEMVEGYQKEMIERAGDEVRLSLMNTEMLHDWERVKESPLMKVGGYAKGQSGAAEAGK